MLIPAAAHTLLLLYGADLLNSEIALQKATLC